MYCITKRNVLKILATGCLFCLNGLQVCRWWRSLRWCWVSGTEHTGSVSHQSRTLILKAQGLLWSSACVTCCLAGSWMEIWRKKITHKTDISPNHKFKINFYNHQKQSWNFPISQSELTHRSPPLRRSGLNSVVFIQGLWPWPNPHAPMGFLSAHHTPNPPGTFRAFCGFFLGPHFPGPQLLIQTAFLKLLVL